MSPLPGSDKYRRTPEVTARRKKTNALIDAANELPIQTLLSDEFATYVPSELQRSWKTYCPFSFQHPDGGVDKTLRVYPSNTAYCFALHGMMSPVRLIMIRKDLKPEQAARWICERYGLSGPKEPYWERMPKLVLEHELRTSAGGSPAYAVEALHQALVAMPGYSERQFDPDVTREMERWLTRLDELEGVQQEGALRGWFTEALDAIGRVASVKQ